MQTRLAAVAGQFYPSDPETLRATVETYIDDAQVSAASEPVRAIVSPHAGYVYSGPAAGYSFARVRGKTPTRVILLGRYATIFFHHKKRSEEGNMHCHGGPWEREKNANREIGVPEGGRSDGSRPFGFMQTICVGRRLVGWFGFFR